MIPGNSRASAMKAFPIPRSNQFKVITRSVKKTDPNDARNLALYLVKDLLRLPPRASHATPRRREIAACCP